MAKAKKLPSGRWRALVYDYTDGNGKRHYKSFTADAKKEAEYTALEYITGKKKNIADMTISEAIGGYITAKSSVLSPSTEKAYRSLQRSRYAKIDDIPLKDVTSPTIQLWLSTISTEVAPKTAKNAYGLLSASLEMFAPDLSIHVTLPQAKKPDLYCPTTEDVLTLLDICRGTELELAILLAAYGPMRRGEICALESSDIVGNSITVRKSMVKKPDNTWVIKQPKTYSGYRTISFPQFVIDKIPDTKGRIFQSNPSQISDAFFHVLKKSGLPHFRFHDLRHYAASIMHAQGMPDQYIIDRGGWRTDTVMKTIYRTTLDDEKKKQNDRINKFFEEMQHDMQHKNQKSP